MHLYLCFVWALFFLLDENTFVKSRQREREAAAPKESGAPATAKGEK